MREDIQQALERNLTTYVLLEMQTHMCAQPHQERLVILDPMIEDGLYHWAANLIDGDQVPLPPIPRVPFWILVDAMQSNGHATGVASCIHGHNLFLGTDKMVGRLPSVDCVPAANWHKWNRDLTITEKALCASLIKYTRLALFSGDPDHLGGVQPKHIDQAWTAIKYQLDIPKRTLGARCGSVTFIGYNEKWLLEAMNMETAVGVPDVEKARHIAIIGGDARLHRQTWPDGFEVKTFEADDHARLISSHKQTPFNTVIVLSRWISHASYKAVRDACNGYLRIWNNGIPRLAKELESWLAEPAVAASIPPAATRGDVDMAMITWSKSILEALATFGDKEWTAEEIADFLDVPLAEYSAVLDVIERMAGRGQLVFAQMTPVPKYKALPAPPEPAPTTTETPMPEKPPEKPLMSLTPESPFAVSVGASTIECDTLAEALELVTKYGDKAVLWKRMKVRLKAELDE